jgi:hypothetical protein
VPELIIVKVGVKGRPYVAVSNSITHKYLHSAVSVLRKVKFLMWKPKASFYLNTDFVDVIKFAY